MSSESPTKPGLDEASAPAQPERPPPKHIFEGHEDQITSLVFLHDNIHIVSSSSDGTMRKWDYETGLLVGKPMGRGGRTYMVTGAFTGRKDDSMREG